MIGDVVLFHFMQRATADGAEPETRSRPAIVLDIDSTMTVARLHVFWSHEDWPILKPSMWVRGPEWGMRSLGEVVAPRSDILERPLVASIAAWKAAATPEMRRRLHGTWTVRS